MQARQFTTSGGRDLIAIAGNNWHIAGIRINNPSPSWLLVSSINEFVPPYVQGWQRTITPVATSLDVRHVDSPSGSVSATPGNELIIVDLYDEPLPDTDGVTSGAGRLVSTVPEFKLTSSFAASLTAGLGDQVLMITAPDTRRLVIVRISCLLHNAGFGSTGVVQVQWRTPDMAPFDFEWFQALSPEAPYASDVFADGSAKIQPGERFYSVWYSEGGVSNQQGRAQLQYYEEEVL